MEWFHLLNAEKELLGSMDFNLPVDLWQRTLRSPCRNAGGEICPLFFFILYISP